MKPTKEERLKILEQEKIIIEELNNKHKLPKPTKADEPTNCPNCKVSLLGEAIPENIKHHYSGNYWKREIGVEYQGVYDGVHHYECPDCKHKFGGIQELRGK